MEKIINKIMQAYEEMYINKYTLQDEEKAEFYKEQYFDLCLDNNVTPRNNKILRKRIDDYIDTFNL